MKYVADVSYEFSTINIGELKSRLPPGDLHCLDKLKRRRPVQAELNLYIKRLKIRLQHQNYGPQAPPPIYQGNSIILTTWQPYQW